MSLMELLRARRSGETGPTEPTSCVGELEAFVIGAGVLVEEDERGGLFRTIDGRDVYYAEDTRW